MPPYITAQRIRGNRQKKKKVVKQVIISNTIGIAFTVLLLISKLANRQHKAIPKTPTVGVLCNRNFSMRCRTFFFSFWQL